ncbi:hypothetical protein HanRHA438_Chr02g0048261 [Helianthus annuus]|uniref:DUF4283 domain-containing protein n=1 Tax=Helianthus annuus TaxID=4232 RepID=A0A9K3JKS1_HELAN|nr:hypothetical protein HanXRQr2_Chr02g0047021 [Helianthus annuus]KAJ0603464.1 hypothetical protein HanHA300_Chr02g0038541 [Helianthus annuus]KAJ0613534.1 hypothetical protein HanIR_Chr02g0052421 [Helianthus annuus]KAJ0617377.1 hypothetical protein HanHA89_Chr02g0041181 [Helianthus annuus]KAJ0775917.1 hypothetical protein HanLR1_Chr02g0039701 [Helianthus annuus]
MLGKSKGVGESVSDVGGASGAGSVASEKTIIVPDRTSAFKELYGLAVVGRTVDLETLVDFNKLLKIAKTEFSRLHYLGGLSVLISFADEASAKRFLDSRGVWGPWFNKLEMWGGQSLPLERVAWLKLIGIPLHLLDMDVLMKVGELFGKVLHIPKISDGEQDLSIFRVGVLAEEASRIREAVTLKWKNRSFRVWVEEE